MLLVPLSVRPSAIHGNGLFADQEIQTGTVVWRFVAGLDRLIPTDEINKWPAPARKHVVRCWGAADGARMSFGDHAGFLNHSNTPNLVMIAGELVAIQDIPADSEITADYNRLNFSGVVQ